MKGDKRIEYHSELITKTTRELKIEYHEVIRDGSLNIFEQNAKMNLLSNVLSSRLMHWYLCLDDEVLEMIEQEFMSDEHVG